MILLLMIPYKGFLLLCTGRSRRTCEMPLYFHSFNSKNGNPELLHSGKGTVNSQPPPSLPRIRTKMEAIYSAVI